MSATTVALVGVGPRGLSVFERLSAVAGALSDRSFVVHLIDNVVDGVGIHRQDQKRYIKMNTPTHLPTMFPGRIGDDPRVWRTGPSFEEWCRLTHGTVNPFGYMPRAEFGRYLNFCYDEMLAHAPANMVVRHQRSRVVDIVEHQSGQLSATLENGERVEADAVVLATGHCNDAGSDNSRVIDDAYPTHIRLSSIDKADTVGIAGMGLTAHDLIGELTQGRGGVWSRDGERPHYLPGGNEPTILLFSRSGIPSRARPRADGTEPYMPSEAQEIFERLQSAEHVLDFAEEIEPVIYQAMSAAFEDASENAGSAHFGDPRDRISRLRVSSSSNAPRALLWPTVAHNGDQRYREWFIGFLQSDLKEARLGTRRSAEKAALEVLFNGRGFISDLVSFGRIGERSREDFYERFVPAMNRSVVGPQLERNEELLELVRVGIVRPIGPATFEQSTPASGKAATIFAHGDGERHYVDWLCSGKSIEPRIERSQLLRALSHRRYVKPNGQLGGAVPGIAIDPQNRVIAADGKSRPIWAIGPLCEGSRYYNNYVPFSNGFKIGPAFREAHALVVALLGEKHSGASSC